MSEIPDRRRVARLTVPRHLRGTALEHHDVLLLDCGPLGARARITHRTPLHEGVGCAVEFPPALGPLRLTGRVVWTRIQSTEQTLAGDRRTHYESGIEFTDLAPDQQTALAATLAALPVAAAPARATVLCIDDDPLVLYFYRDFLAGHGYRTLAVLDGLQGLTLAHQDRPDVILLDVMLRGLSGFDICRKLRADPALRDIPILLLTTWNHPSVLRPPATRPGRPVRSKSPPTPRRSSPFLRRCSASNPTPPRVWRRTGTVRGGRITSGVACGRLPRPQRGRMTDDTWQVVVGPAIMGVAVYGILGYPGLLYRSVPQMRAGGASPRPYHSVR